MKPIFPNKPLLNNSFGRILQHDNYLNQSVTTNSSPTFNNLVLTGDTTINGSLFVYGNTTLLETNLIEFEDNILLLNSKETGNGVFLNKSGIEINRGNLENFQLVFNESQQSLQVGFLSDLKNVPRQEPNPTHNYFMFWDSVNNQLISSNHSLIDFTFFSTTESINLSTASLVVSGGLSIQKDARLNKTLFLYNSTSASSILTNNFNNLVLSSPDNILLQPSGSSIIVPTNKLLGFNSTTNSISADNFNNLIIRSGNSINISTASLNIPNQIPLTFSTPTERILTDDSNNMVIESNNSIILKPSPSQSVSIPANYSLSFYSLSQRITSNINNDLFIYSGNDIHISPSPNNNIILPSQTGIILGNTTNNLFSNISNDLFFTLKNLTISSNLTTANIIISSNIPLCFNSTSSNLRFTNGNLVFSGNSIFNNSIQFNNTLSLIDTTNSISTSSGAFVISGGVGIQKNTFIGGDLTVNGNFNVLGSTTTINSTEYLINDNIIVLNNGPVGLLDGGLLVKHYISGTSGSTMYSGVIFKQDSNSFIFTSSTSDSSQISPNYIPIQSSQLTLHSNLTALNFTSGGALSCLGGASFKESVLFGDNILVNNLISSSSLSTTFSTLSNTIISNSQITNLSSSNFISTNSTLSNLNLSNLNVANSTLGNSNISSLISLNNTLSNLIVTNSSHSNIYSTYFTAGNFFAVNTSFSNFACLNSTMTNIISTNFVSTNTIISDYSSLGNIVYDSSTMSNLYTTFHLSQNSTIASLNTVNILNTNITSSSVNVSGRVISRVDAAGFNANFTAFPLVDGSESSIAFYNNTSGSASSQGNVYVIGHNVFGSGNRTFGIGTPFNGSILTMQTSGHTHFNNNINIIRSGTTPSLVISGGIAASNGANIVLKGAGSHNASVNIDLSTYDHSTNAPTSRIQAIDFNLSSHLQFLTKVPGSGTNPLAPRMHIQNDGNIGINTTSPTHRLHVNGSCFFTDISTGSFVSTSISSSSISTSSSTFSNTLITNSSISSLLVSNNTVITNTQNSLSITSGGALTVNGGSAFGKDMYIGGNLYVSGLVNGNNINTGSSLIVSSPTLSFSNFTNCSLSTYSNSKLLLTDDQLLLSFAVELLPSSDSLYCQFELTLPSISSNFTSYSDIVPSISGFSDVSNLTPLFNCLVVSKPSSQNCIIKFNSISTSIHYIFISIRYTQT